MSIASSNMSIREIGDDAREAMNDLLLGGRSDFLFSHLFESYHDFIERIVQKEMRETEHVFHTKEHNNSVYTSFFVFENVMLQPAKNKQTGDYLLPMEARNRKLNYSGDIIVDITQKLRVRNLLTGEVQERVVQDTERGVIFTTIPIMVRSKYCVLKIKPYIKSGECIHDHGGYFIVGGQEKVVISQERICDNKIMVFAKKSQSNSDQRDFHVQVHSKKTDISLPQDIKIYMNSDESLVLSSTHFEKVPLYVFMKALGLQSDFDIQMVCVRNPEDKEMINMLYKSYLKFRDMMIEEGEEKRPVQTQEDAMMYILETEKLMRYGGIFDEKDKELRNKKKRERLTQILTNEFIPHVDNNMLTKAYYVGAMVNKLLSCVLGRRDIDDRDSHVNKRVDPPGILLGQIFRQYFGKMIKDCTKFYAGKVSDPNEPIYIVDHVNQNLISQSLNSALSTGTWGSNKTRTGVAQMLQRISYPAYITFLRKINTPGIDTSTSKVVSMREIHPAHYGFICPTESPDGATIGISKHLALSARITSNLASQTDIIQDLLQHLITSQLRVPLMHLHQYTTVMLNGNWIGVTKLPDDVVETFRQYRMENKIHRTCSIVFLRRLNEINIYTDGGRLYRPLYVVRNSELAMKAEVLERVKRSELESWSQLLLEYPEAVEYVDIEESEELMVARNVRELMENKEVMEREVTAPNRVGNPVNRYDGTVYVHYTHCEMDDLFEFGLLANSVPFADHNAAVRNIYNHGQQRQPIHQYCTNPHNRMDKSYMSFNSSRPLIHSRMMKYSKFDVMGYGEQTVVAVLCYTGANQEDSLIGNQSAFELGEFKIMTYKVVEERLNKNQATSLNDEFKKPNPDDVALMKKANYEKLNEFGYVPEETHVQNGDVLIGKVSHIPPSKTGKIYKDNSKIYQSSQEGVVDIFHHLVDEEGYDIYQMKIRSSRMPVIGDKMASVCAQKGTIGLTLRRSEMPYTKDGIQPTLIVNPNCVPSRMTIAMFLEQLLGKKCAIEAKFGDGTPLNNKVDFDSVCDALEAAGYHRYGLEELYSGIDGKKMEAMIMVAPQYYMRLKQMVDDKKHARATGPKQALERQPPPGTTKDGGLRVGEMERDTFIAHGTSLALHERFMRTSDQYQIMICDRCGHFATKLKNKKNVYRCKPCNNHTDFSLAEVPYAFKLFTQELQAVNINVKWRTDDSKYHDSLA